MGEKNRNSMINVDYSNREIKVKVEKIKPPSEIKNNGRIGI